MRDIVDIVKKSIFDTINSDLVVLSVTVGVDQSIISFCEGVKWLRVGSEVEFLGEKRKVLSIDENSITVLNFTVDPIKRDKIQIVKKPTWMNGTQMVVNEEMNLKAQSDLRKVTPLVWLSEVIEEDFLPSTNPDERESRIVLFLLDGIENNSMNDEKRNVGVKPMLGLFNEIKNIIEAGVYGVSIGEDERINVKTFSEFGEENNKGVFQMILNADLGGLVVSMTLKVGKENCYC